MLSLETNNKNKLRVLIATMRTWQIDVNRAANRSKRVNNVFGTNRVIGTQMSRVSRALNVERICWISHSLKVRTEFFARRKFARTI